MTAAAAVDGIREVDATGSIGIVSAEPDAPYNRPPLSKGLWKGESTGRDLAQDERESGGAASRSRDQGDRSQGKARDRQQWKHFYL